VSVSWFSWGKILQSVGFSQYGKTANPSQQFLGQFLLRKSQVCESHFSLNKTATPPYRGEDQEDFFLGKGCLELVNKNPPHC
jgi:hypothetical protein